MPRTNDLQKPHGDPAATELAVRAAFRATFGTDHGQLVLRTLQASCGCLPGERKSPFPVSGPIDPTAAALRAGRQSVCDDIENLLAHAEDAPSPGGPSAIR